VRFGAHLPLIEYQGQLLAYVDTARDLGYHALGANDHLVFQRPWLDGIVALASAIDRSGEMQLTTTVALPVVRGAAALARSAAALDTLSGGRLVLGVGPGSSAADYAAAGVDFDRRWPLFDESIRALREHLPPGRPPIWIGSWGSAAGLRRVARSGDGWIASAYNITPARVAAARRQLGPDLPCALATMWTYVTEDRAAADRQLAELGRMLNRPPAELAERVLVGPAQECAAKLTAYAEAGVDQMFVWPLADRNDQLERFMREVAAPAGFGAAG
jgi:alkanesulfonate monooxygenase SsuD/methylene tetrahydromethanopterin reductase-like flavin-dependent oxidoreductase (luciferase family)